MTSTLSAPLLLAVIALVPAAMAWWSGRKLAALVDDPAFPERLNADQRRNGALVFVALAALTFIAFESLIWTLPLTVSALVAAGYPLRRSVYGETWSLGAYLWFFARAMFAWSGFWILLGATPSLARLAGGNDWLVAALLGGTLVLWNARFAAVFRRCLRSAPLQGGPLLDRCRALADRCGLRPVHFERIDLGGGVVANAAALPSPGRSSVLFSSTLIERLEEDETVAICGHELAHLEYYDAPRLRRLNLVTHLLILLAATWTPAARLAGVDSGLLPTVLWLSVLTIALVMRAKDRQRLESASDRRAVELTGQPEALVAALTKLHTIARIPRRLETRQEQSASHPSLARRIRDIRTAAGAAAGELPTTSTFASADGRQSLTFDDDALHWSEGAPETWTLSYAALAELRIDARGSGQPRLVAIGTDARCREMPLAPGDVVRVQAVLDVLDCRLGDSPPPGTLPISFTRMFAAFALAFVFALGHAAAAFVALLALIRPTSRLLAAAGLAALTGAAMTLGSYQPENGLSAAFALPPAAIGIVMLLLARRERHDNEGDIRPALVALAGGALLALAALPLNGFALVRLHQSAIAGTALPVLLVALAGALVTSGARRSKWAGFAAALVAALVVTVASPLFLDAFERDPLLIRSPEIEWVELSPEPLAEFDVPDETSRVALSPDANHIAVLLQTDLEEDGTSTFQVGPVGGRLEPLRADHLLFADNEHLLAVSSDDGGTMLKKIGLGDLRSVAWQQLLPDLSATSFSFDPATARWSLIGWMPERVLARAEGVIGDSRVEERRWPSVLTRSAHISAIATKDSELLVVENRYDRGALEAFIPRQWTWALLLQPFNQDSVYWSLDNRGRTDLGSSRLGADCDSGIADNAVVCTVYDGTRTRLISIDTGGVVSPIGLVPGRFVSDDATVKGWLTGWSGSRPAAIRLDARLAIGPPAGTIVGHLAVSGDRLAAVTFTGAGTKVRTYEVGVTSESSPRRAVREHRASSGPR
jgi:Zn-dependent protease with chaperone function